MEIVYIITGVLDTVATVQYLFIRAALSDFTHHAIADLPLSDGQTTIAVDIFWFEIIK